MPELCSTTSGDDRLGREPQDPHAPGSQSTRIYVPASFALLHAIEHFGEHVAHVSLTRQLWDARNAT